MKTLCLVLFFAAGSLLAQQSAPSIEAARRDFFPVQSQAALMAAPVRDDVLQDTPSGERKSIGLAAIYSFLLPGMGELYVGEYGMGKYFTIAEGALWVSLAGVDLYANALQDDARRYAALHAGTAYDGKDDQYFIDISNFNTVYEFNEQVLRDRDPQKLYDPMSPDYWSWDNAANRSLYRDQRVSADRMFNNTRFIAAAIAVNHVVSAINAARLAFSHNRGLDKADLIDVKAGLLGTLDHPDGVTISVSRRF
jgi:hypothetical protein